MPPSPSLPRSAEEQERWPYGQPRVRVLPSLSLKPPGTALAPGSTHWWHTASLLPTPKARPSPWHAPNRLPPLYLPSYLALAPCPGHAGRPPGAHSVGRTDGSSQSHMRHWNSPEQQRPGTGCRRETGGAGRARRGGAITPLAPPLVGGAGRAKQLPGRGGIPRPAQARSDTDGSFLPASGPGSRPANLLQPRGGRARAGLRF